MCRIHELDFCSYHFHIIRFSRSGKGEVDVYRRFTSKLSSDHFVLFRHERLSHQVVDKPLGKLCPTINSVPISNVFEISLFRHALNSPSSPFLVTEHIFVFFRCQDIMLSFLSLSLDRNRRTRRQKFKQKFSLDCQVVFNLDTMGLRDIKTHILQTGSFPSSRRCNSEHECII